MLEFIDPLYFLVAFFIGIFYTYLTTPTPEIIIRYPTPENAGKIIYRDRADVCYKYKAKEVSCPANKSEIKKLDIQSNDKVEEPSLFEIVKRKVKEMTNGSSDSNNV